VSTDLDRMKREAERLRAQQQRLRAAQRAEEEKRRAQQPKPTPTPKPTGYERAEKEKERAQTPKKPKKSTTSTSFQRAEQEKRRATGSQTDQEKVQIQIQEAKDSLKQAESYTEAYGGKVTFGDKTYDLGNTEGWKEYNQAVREYRSQIHRAETKVKLVVPTTWKVGDKTFDTSYKAAQYAKKHPVYVIAGVDKVFNSKAEAQKYVRGLEAAATGPPAPGKNKIIKSSTVTPPGMVYHLGVLMTQKQFERDFPKGTKPSGPIITSTGITAASLWNAWEDVFTPQSKRLDKMSDKLTNEAAEAMYDGKPWAGFLKYLQAKGVDASKTVYETTTGLVRPQSWVDFAQGVGLILTPTEQLSRKEYMARIDAQLESDIKDPALRAEAKKALLAVAPYQTVSDEAIKNGKEYRSQLGSIVAKDPFGVAVNIGAAIVGGYALGKLVNGARSALEREAIKRTRGGFSIEDYYIPDELMEMERIRYPVEVSGYETFYDQTLVKQNMRMISELDGSGAIAWSPELLSKRIPEGALYKLGTEAYGYEYGLLRTGGDLIPVAIPKGKGELIPVYKPEMVTWVQNWVRHNPGVILDLEAAALQGYRVPAWLGVLGPGAKTTSKEIVAELTKIGLTQRKINAILPTIKTIPEFSQRDIEKLKDILKKKSVNDIKLALFDLADTRVESIQGQRERQEAIQKQPTIQREEEDYEGVPDLPPTPEEPPPEEPPPEEPEKPPKLSLADQQKRRELNLRLHNGPREKYKVRISFPRGPSQTLTVFARSFPEAVNKAQRSRRGNRYLPSEVDIERVG